MLHHLLRILCVPVIILLASCHYPQNEDRWIEPDNKGIDSIAFRETHHYWRGDNFIATDSFYIKKTPPSTNLVYGYNNNSESIKEGHIIVVDDIIPDTTKQPIAYWLRIATATPDEHGSFTAAPHYGWVEEHVFLKNAVPDHPLSRLIHRFSDQHLKVILCLIVLSILIYIIYKSCRKNIRIVHFNDINSFYPTLLCLTTSGLALLYQSIQVHIPETWIEYYFHPTINPLDPGIPIIMQLFLGGIWLAIFLGIATIDEIRHHLGLADAFSYIVGLCGFCGLLYTFFTAIIPPMAGYFLLPAYWVFAILHFKKKQQPLYFCGNCGKTIEHLGKCPHCGAINTRSLL